MNAALAPVAEGQGHHEGVHTRRDGAADAYSSGRRMRGRGGDCELGGRWLGFRCNDAADVSDACVDRFS